MEISKGDNFSEWYSKVLFEAGIVDIRYPVKGMPVYMPWGFRMMDCMFRTLESLLDAAGHGKALFPIAIPESVFSKESEHIKGFEDEVLWITHGGNTPLEDRLVMRPTSETGMYPMFSLWVRSHADLPLKIYQTTSVYRHETKATRPLIRGREVYWNEAHTAHTTFDDAAGQVEQGIGVYKNFFNQMCIPCKVMKRPEHDKFPGAVYTYAFDTILPDGKILQVGTVHHLGDNFSKAYDVKYSDEGGSQIYAQQTSYGISMRALAAVLGVHGDDRGLVLPYPIAPVQVVFVPIYSKGNENEVDSALLPVFDGLKAVHRCVYDNSAKRPGEKYYYWEMKGVPMRVEAGMRDLSAGKVTIVDRLGERHEAPIGSAAQKIDEVISQYGAQLAGKARAIFEGMVRDASSLDELASIREEKRGMIRAGWCGDMQCADRLKGLAVDILGTEKGCERERACIVCGRNGNEVYVGKPY